MQTEASGQPMKLIQGFVSQFNARIDIDVNLVAKKQKRYFLLNPELKKLCSEEFFYAGTYLGKAKGGIFFPSFPLLEIIAKDQANRVVVDRKTEWLFICGRDVFKQGIKKVVGTGSKGEYVLVMNEYGECLGFGRTTCNIREEMGKSKVAVKNVSDIGDFLRRERATPRARSH